MTTAECDIDTDRLGSYLTDHLEERVVGIEVLHDGLNLSLSISTGEQADAYVVRHPRKLRETAFFNDLSVEYRLMERLDETAIPTPTPVLLCDDSDVIGGPFFLMEFLDGQELPVGSRLPEQYRTPDARRTLAESFFDTLTEIHTLPTRQFEDICEFQSPEDQIEAAIDRLDDARPVTGLDRPVLREVGDWLRENSPDTSQRALLHGDYKPGNVFFGGDEVPTVTGVTDWETAYIGDPLTELAYALTYWRDSDDSPPAVGDLRGEYDTDALRDVRRASENGLYPFTTDPGSPSREELIARYEDKTGYTFENARFYRAREAFVLATVWEDLHRAHIEAGGASDGRPLVEYMARVARRIIDGTL